MARTYHDIAAQIVDEDDTSQETKRKAARVACRFAKNADEAREFLDILGLTDSLIAADDEETDA